MPARDPRDGRRFRHRARTRRRQARRRHRQLAGAAAVEHQLADRVGKPSKVAIEERIHDPIIKIDNDLAVVWAPFDFYADGKVDRYSIVFLRKIVEGGTDKSYGIQVARLAGVPKEVLERAKQILGNLEESELTPEGTVRQSPRRQQDRDE